MSNLSKKQIETLKNAIIETTSLNGLWESYPEDFIESRTDYDEIKNIANSFYYTLKEIFRSFEKEIS